MKQNKDAEDFQEQALAMIREQQEAYLEAVKAWLEAAESARGQRKPPWPEPPSFEPLPNPAEVAEVSYAFAAKLLAEQSRFMERLSEVIAEHEPEHKRR